MTEAAVSRGPGAGETLTDTFRGVADFGGRALSEGLDFFQDPKYSGLSTWLAFGVAAVGAGMAWTIGSAWATSISEKGLMGAIQDYAGDALKIAAGVGGLLYAGAVGANLLAGRPLSESLYEPLKAFGNLTADAFHGVDDALNIDENIEAAGDAINGTVASVLGIEDPSAPPEGYEALPAGGDPAIPGAGGAGEVVPVVPNPDLAPGAEDPFGPAGAGAAPDPALDPTRDPFVSGDAPPPGTEPAFVPPTGP